MGTVARERAHIMSENKERQMVARQADACSRTAAHDDLPDNSRYQVFTISYMRQCVGRIVLLELSDLP